MLKAEKIQEQSNTDGTIKKQKWAIKNWGHIATPPVIPDTCAETRISVEAGGGDAGTIILSSGSDGRMFYCDLEIKNETKQSHVRCMVGRLIKDGYKVIEIRWPAGIWTQPISGNSSAIHKSRRYTTLVKKLKEEEHLGTGIFVVQGNCGGSSQVGFGLCYHGLGNIVQLANMGSPFPPCPRIIEPDYGIECDNIDVVRTPPRNRTDAEQRHCLSEIIHEQLVYNHKLLMNPPHPRYHSLDLANPTIPGPPYPEYYGDYPSMEEAGAILSGSPVRQFPKTDVRLFVGEKEKLDFIWGMALVFYRSITAHDKSLEFLVDTDHRIFNYANGVKALYKSIKKTAGNPPPP